MMFPQIWEQLTDKLHAMEIKDLTKRAQELGFMNEEERQTHQQQILKLNEEHQQSLEEKEQEINHLIANRHVARSGYFGNDYFDIRCQHK